ncbi:MAG TPA: protein translocase subunit SecF [Candidatus Nitrosocosmicus sp.]|nr:protein translocase subunit SecF [Candidatus Nitrosocosmicus sp.]
MINFLKYRWLYFLISGITILSGLFSIISYGYKVSIDFAGGTVVEYKINKDISEKKVQDAFDKQKVKVHLIEKNQQNYLIRSESLDQQKELVMRQALSKENNATIETLRFETVGPAIGRETMNKTILAALVAIMGILTYMTFAFKNIKYGIAAILAMLHDFLVVIGAYSLMSKFFGAELDSLFVTALLTTMSFSVHDTIVVFDKIREYRKGDKHTAIDVIANKSLTETMVRSLNNSLTIVLMLVALLLLGGDTIKFFTATLLVGTITGTYSSPFIATPILAWLERKKN